MFGEITKKKRNVTNNRDSTNALEELLLIHIDLTWLEDFSPTLASPNIMVSAVIPFAIVKSFSRLEVESSCS